MIQYENNSIAFLYDTFHWKNELYENAWYLELLSEDNPETGVILPEGSRYIPMLIELLKNLHYEELS